LHDRYPLVKIDISSFMRLVNSRQKVLSLFSLIFFYCSCWMRSEPAATPCWQTDESFECHSQPTRG